MLVILSLPFCKPYFVTDPNDHSLHHHHLIPAFAYFVVRRHFLVLAIFLVLTARSSNAKACPAARSF